ncbi:MAG: hypothetical protein GF364_00475, partial [Candidatus Lokiarchaeota archaeon]|nr:hypothetical protein [Candidatus Lokiarchaeota archaeon]
MSFKRHNKIILASLLLVLFISSVYAPLDVLNTRGINDENYQDVEEEFPWKDPDVSAQYSNIITDNGDEINMELGMVYDSNTVTSLNNTIGENNKSINVMAPMDSNFNSSYYNITVGNIRANNYTDTIQDGTFDGFEPLSTNIDRVTSFVAPSSCHLDNFSVYLQGTGSTIYAYLYNATYNNTEGRIEPDSLSELGSFSLSTNWIDVDVAEDLDSDNTYANTWFIGLFTSSGGNWLFDRDGVGNNDTESYKYNTGGYWEYIEDSGSTVDLFLKVGFAASNTSTILPSDVGLQINGTDVNDYAQGDLTGKWESNDEIAGIGGKLNVSFSCGYPNTQWDVYNVTVNYTKSDLEATSTFNVETNKIVNWEINKSINLFNSSFQNYTIKYSVPDEWTVGSAYNWTDEYTPVVNDTTGTYKDAWIYDAGNSSTHDWSLQCTSANFAKNISIFENGGSQNSTSANYSDTLDFLAGFDDPISGDVNISVYSPSGYLNYSTVNSSLTDEYEVWFPIYDISGNLSEYGEFSVQYKWNNATYVAFWEQNFTISAETNLTLISADNPIYTSEDIFNITVYYNDTGLDSAITGGSISYSINTGTPSSDNVEDLDDGNYNITIYGWDVGAFGSITVDINASKSFYDLNTTQFSFTLFNKTEQNLPDGSSYDVVRGDNVTIVAEYLYNDSVSGIEDATLNWDSNNAAFENSWTDGGAGTYNLELDSTNVEGSATPYNIDFNITSGNNETQEYTVSVTVLNNTQVEIVSLSQPNYGHTDSGAPYEVYYGKDTIVTVRLIDLDNGNAIVTGGQANLTYSGSTDYNTTDDSGEFQFTLDTDTSAVAGSPYTITDISINATGFETTSLSSTNFDIINCPTRVEVDSIDVGVTPLTYYPSNNTYQGEEYGSDITISVSLYNDLS